MLGWNGSQMPSSDGERQRGHQIFQDRRMAFRASDTANAQIQRGPRVRARPWSRRRHAHDQGLGSKLQYWETQQDLIEHEQELMVQQSRLAEAIAGSVALREQRRQSEAEYSRTNFNDLADAQQKAVSLREDLLQAERRRQLQTLTAPVDGAVQQLAVHTIGGVVTPAQQLMVIVPADARLEAEAMVSNRDIGFVHAGQSVEIKVDTFNFTRYGLLHGEVVSIFSRFDCSRQAAGSSGYLQTRHDCGDQRAAGPRVALRSPDRAGLYTDANRGQADRRFIWHGGHSGNQYGLTKNRAISAVSASAVQAGEFAGKVRPKCRSKGCFQG
jgi:hypothetical protein